jgi:hypothetical protein
MGQLLKTIRRLVSENRYLIGLHALERLEERQILEWQVVSGLEDAIVILARPEAMPNPAVEVRELLPDGTEIKAVWSYLPHSNVAKLITVHYFDG